MRMYSGRESDIIEKVIKPNLKLIHQLKIKGLKDKYIAQALGISVKEFLSVKESYEVLNDVYNDAMEILCSQLTDIVVSRALGQDGRVDKDGNPLPPDEKLAFKLLEKLDGRFANKQEIKQTFTIESIIKKISANRNEEMIDLEGYSDVEEEEEEEEL